MSPERPTIPLRTVFAVLAVAALGLAAGYRGGFYTPLAILGAVVALGLTLAACSPLAERTWHTPPRLGRMAVVATLFLLGGLFMRFANHPEIRLGLLVLGGIVMWIELGPFGDWQPRSVAAALLASTALLLSGSALLCNGLLYAESGWAMQLVSVSAIAGFLLIAASLVLDLPAAGEKGRAFWPRVFLLFLMGTLLRVGAVQASPQPVHDLYDWLRDAPQHLLQGENPYAAEYASPYTTERARQYGLQIPAADPHVMVYPPLPILFALPFRAVGLDVRYANVLCDVLAAAVLLLAASRRGRPLVGALAAGLYLNLPRMPVVTEAAFFEPMLAMLLGGGLLLAERGRGRLGAGVLALGLTGKQFGLPLFPAAWRALRRYGYAPAVIVGVVGVAVILPFFLWGPQAFLNVVILKHLDRAPDLAFLTLPSAAHHLFGWSVPKVLAWGVAAVLIAWVAWRTPQKGVGSAWWLGASLLIFCLCHTQSYLHYFYLCVYLLLLGTTALACEEVQECREAMPASEPLRLAA